MDGQTGRADGWSNGRHPILPHETLPQPKAPYKCGCAFTFPFSAADDCGSWGRATAPARARAEPAADTTPRMLPPPPPTPVHILPHPWMQPPPTCTTSSNSWSRSCCSAEMSNLACDAESDT
eukprot:363724-Chlamydomonas_euryale.AAC.2